MDIPTPEDFDEAEYAEATDTVYKAVSGLASQSPCVRLASATALVVCSEASAQLSD